MFGLSVLDLSARGLDGPNRDKPAQFWTAAGVIAVRRVLTGDVGRRVLPLLTAGVGMVPLLPPPLQLLVAAAASPVVSVEGEEVWLDWLPLAVTGGSGS